MGNINNSHSFTNQCVQYETKNEADNFFKFFNLSSKFLFWIKRYVYNCICTSSFKSDDEGEYKTYNHNGKELIVRRYDDFSDRDYNNLRVYETIIKQTYTNHFLCKRNCFPNMECPYDDVELLIYDINSNCFKNDDSSDKSINTIKYHDRVRFLEKIVFCLSLDSDSVELILTRAFNDNSYYRYVWNERILQFYHNLFVEIPAFVAYNHYSAFKKVFGNWYSNTEIEINDFIKEMDTVLKSKFGENNYATISNYEKKYILQTLSEYLEIKNKYRYSFELSDAYKFLRLPELTKRNAVYMSTFNELLNNMASQNEEIHSRESLRTEIEKIITNMTSLNDFSWENHSKIFQLVNDRISKFSSCQNLDKLMNRKLDTLGRNLKFTTRYELIYILFLNSIFSKKFNAINYINEKLNEADLHSLYDGDPVDKLYILALKADQPILSLYNFENNNRLSYINFELLQKIILMNKSLKKQNIILSEKIRNRTDLKNKDQILRLINISNPSNNNQFVNRSLLIDYIKVYEENNSLVDRVNDFLERYGFDVLSESEKNYLTNKW